MAETGGIPESGVESDAVVADAHRKSIGLYPILYSLLIGTLGLFCFCLGLLVRIFREPKRDSADDDKKEEFKDSEVTTAGENMESASLVPLPSSPVDEIRCPLEDTSKDNSEQGTSEPTIGISTGLGESADVNTTEISKSPEKPAEHPAEPEPHPSTPLQTPTEPQPVEHPAEMEPHTSTPQEQHHMSPQ